MCNAGGIVLGLREAPPSSFDGSPSHSHIWSDNASDIAWNLCLPFSQLTVIYSPECVKRMCGKTKERGWQCTRPLSISKRKAGYTEPHGYLCLHLFLSLLIPGLLLCVAPVAHYLSFSLVCFLFRCLSLPLFLSDQLPQADWQHIKWNKVCAAVSDRG